MLLLLLLLLWWLRWLGDCVAELHGMGGAGFLGRTDAPSEELVLAGDGGLVPGARAEAGAEPAEPGRAPAASCGLGGWVRGAALGHLQRTRGAVASRSAR